MNGGLAQLGERLPYKQRKKLTDKKEFASIKRR